jgi:Protein of unknown function (DUF2891)
MYPLYLSLSILKSVPGMRIQVLAMVFLFLGLNSFSQDKVFSISFKMAEEIAIVPLECISVEYPNKLNQTLADSTHLQSPKELHPIFYGCFDWHSSVHGHWMLARIMNKFPESDLSQKINKIFSQQFEATKVKKELIYFSQKFNKSFERTYGWAWYLKLVAELHISPLKQANAWTDNLQSLTDTLVESYKVFLPKLMYPIRVGEHTNTAFGLSLALDYARTVQDTIFEALIVNRSNDFFRNDKACPIDWEPSGFDFLSPCLQEAELMSKVLEKKDFEKWMVEFLPQLFEKDYSLTSGEVIDRTDGKLVHLDGLNFCRAWCFYTLAKVLPKQKEKFTQLGDSHLKASKDHVIGSDYMGSHWLASFYLKALEAREGLE